LIRLPTFDTEKELGGLGYRLVAGIDEVGRGALAGPVFAAAVMIPPDADFTWLPLVRDSKQLSARQRERLFYLIRQDNIPMGLGVVPHTVVDDVGIVRATQLAMCQAVESMPVIPDFLIIDALALPDIALPQKPIVHGDETCISIACASVVAKVSRDRHMAELDGVHPGYGLAEHKGYGTSQHLAGLRQLGPSPIHRRSFAPVRRLIEG
jgi:ribonuclease HII